MWLTTACAALFEEYYAIHLRIEKAAVVRDQTGAWSTVQEYDRLAVGIAALFVIELMNRRDADVSAVVWLDFRVKGS
jgi:hypothetical protein